MDLVTTSLKNGEPVWFGCEVSKRFAGKQGIEDLKIHDFKLVFGVDIQTTMSKGDRLIYGESAMTHAMSFTAVSCDVSLTFEILMIVLDSYSINLIKIFYHFRKTVSLSNFVLKIHGVKIVVKKDTSL